MAQSGLGMRDDLHGEHTSAPTGDAAVLSQPGAIGEFAKLVAGPVRKSVPPADSSTPARCCYQAHGSLPAR